MQRSYVLILLLLSGLLVACEPTYPPGSAAALAQNQQLTVTFRPKTPTSPPLQTVTNTPTLTPTNTPTVTPTLTLAPTLTPTLTLAPTHTLIPTLTPTDTPQPTLSPTPTLPPTKTAVPTHTPPPMPLSACEDRIPSDDDLLTIVTRDYPISRKYEPSDLVPLDDYYSVAVTLGFPTYVREIVIDPLAQLMDDMTEAGLKPTIISGYRSYAVQAIAWDKWMTEYPDRGALLSAKPGTSEHQLGTTIDFGSPELENKFHTYFYKTSEGAWLLENAHLYGFTLSYPRDAFEVTQFYYEPWHYRYVGIELAETLYEENLSLTEYQFDNLAIPCVQTKQPAN